LPVPRKALEGSTQAGEGRIWAKIEAKIGEKSEIAKRPFCIE
jgi:hypothetical protein